MCLGCSGSIQEVLHRDRVREGQMEGGNIREAMQSQNGLGSSYEEEG